MKNIAGLLEERQAIPMVKDQMPLLLEVQDDAWWQGVTLPTLEQVCKKAATAGEAGREEGTQT
ncbi:MAG TPA: hypothetical protein PLB55_24215, partial [Prosthecobacter sp.]|nr:hypothetical protein [Prosthecobacter sp.]